MKRTKKLLALLLIIMIVISSLNIVAFAAGDTMTNATSMNLGLTHSGSITDSSTSEFYKFTLTSSGKVEIKLTAYINALSFYVYDSNGSEVWKSTGVWWNNTTQQLSFNENVDLTSGTYYFAIKQYSGYKGSYNVKLSFSSANESYKEVLGGSNNSLATANLLSLDQTKNGQIASNDNKDIYKIILSSSGRVNFTFAGYFEAVSFYLYDFEGNEIWRSTGNWWDSTAEKLNYIKNFDFSSGVFYFAVSQYSGYTGNYTFSTIFTSANETFEETDAKTDNTILTANSILLNTQYNGNIGVNDEKDFYEFYSSAGSQKITLSSNSEALSFYLYDSNGSEVWRSTGNWWNSTTQKLAYEKEVKMESSGIYYFTVVSYSERTGSYTFNIGDGTTQSKTYKVTYIANGGSVSPSSASVVSGNSVTLPTPTKSYTISYYANGGSGAPPSQKVNLTCKGWSTNSSATSASYSCGASYKPTANTTLYAVWNNSAGTNLSYTKPSRSGYTFLGWSTNSNATSASYAAGNGVTVSGNVSLYAVWQKNQTQEPEQPQIPQIEYKTIFMNYKDTYKIDVEGFIATRFVAEDDSIVSVDSEGNVRSNSTGTSDIYVYDSNGDVRVVYTFEVEYTFWQWIIVILLFGWIWY